MKKCIVRFTINLVLASLFALSCGKEELIGDFAFGSETVGQAIVLGDCQPNPYSLKTMQQALDSLLATKGLSETITLEPTDFYVRFLPRDTTDFNTLTALGLELFDYPLDRELLCDGGFYHDPSIPEGEPTWQYTTVRAKIASSGISYEVVAVPGEDAPCVEIDIPQMVGTKYECEDGAFQGTFKATLLDECYIPEHASVPTKAGDFVVDPEELERLAFSISGWEVDEVDTKATSKKYQAAGRIYVDESKGVRKSINGVKIRVHCSVKYETTYADSTGYFYTTKNFKKNKANVAVIFNNEKDFVIWENCNYFTPAKYTFKDVSLSCAVNKTIPTTAEDSWRSSIINNTAYEYYCECERTGVSVPPKNLKILSRKNNTWSSAPMLHHMKGYRIGFSLFGPLVASYVLAGLPDLFIINKNVPTSLKSHVWHELSHASHFSDAGEPVWSKYINHIVNASAKRQDTYGDGKAGTDREKICELGEAWANASEKMYNRDAYIDYYWFKNAANALFDVMDSGTLSRPELFSSVTSVNSIDDLFDHLVLNQKDKERGITEQFAKNSALSYQTVWRLKFPINTFLSVTSNYKNGITVKSDVAKIDDDGMKQISFLFSRDILGLTEIRGNEALYPQEIIIKKNNVTIYREKEGKVLQDYGEGFWREADWRQSDINIEAGNKSSRIYTYEIR